MKFRVYRLATGSIDDRSEIEVPDEEVFATIRRTNDRAERLQNVLELAWRYGQRQTGSILLGDVIRYAGGLYVVGRDGYSEFDAASFADYLQLSHTERQFSIFVRPTF